ncbi:GntR family transcriptional regulator [Arthrobacter sp. NPDC092385]|uniref:GntR family transcriptional regulator n=1 Tax=Arthrobacter sp. NPDC092385 TaxID=3363943 RepID=UPI003817C355
MSTLLRIDLSSPVPPFEQIRAGIERLIARGALDDGARLPTVRSLAADLGVATGTVARAYRELEQAGLVEGRGRRGTLVRVPPTDGSSSGIAGNAERAVPPDIDPDVDPDLDWDVDPDIGPDLREAVALAVTAARAGGVSAEDLAVLVRRAYAAPAPGPDIGGNDQSA